MNEEGLTIEAVYSDPDLIEVVVTARNRWFAGWSPAITSETRHRRRRLQFRQRRRPSIGSSRNSQGSLPLARASLT